MPHIPRFILVALTLAGVLTAALFGGTIITASAASSSLPGDTLHSLKTAIENNRLSWTNDPAIQADLHLQFASRRLSEAQSLLDRKRYADMPQAVSEFVNHIQKALTAIDNLSQTDPIRASAMNEEVSIILLSYNNLLVQELAGDSHDNQPVDGNFNNTSQIPDDDDGDDDGSEDGQLSTNTPIASASASIDLPTDTPANSPTNTPVIIPTRTVAVPPASSVVEGQDAMCESFIGAVTVENLYVPEGASCTLDGTRVEGNIKVANGASLMAQRITVIGNIQAEGSSYIEILADSTVGGNIQLKQGGAARVEDVSVNGDIQFESNNGALIAAGNWVGGNIQVFQNNGSVTISDNSVNGNLQCKENVPAPTGGNNIVQGSKEDQCAGL